MMTPIEFLGYVTGIDPEAKREIVKGYGNITYIKMNEECLELAKEMDKISRGTPRYDKCIEEIADVLLSIDFIIDRLEYDGVENIYEKINEALDSKRTRSYEKFNEMVNYNKEKEKAINSRKKSIYDNIDKDEFMRYTEEAIKDFLKENPDIILGKPDETEETYIEIK